MSNAMLERTQKNDETTNLVTKELESRVYVGLKALLRVKRSRVLSGEKQTVNLNSESQRRHNRVNSSEFVSKSLATNGVCVQAKYYWLDNHEDQCPIVRKPDLLYASRAGQAMLETAQTLIVSEVVLPKLDGSVKVCL